MKPKDRITTLRYLTFLSASAERPSRVTPEGASRSNAAVLVQWYESDGKTETSRSEIWVKRSADIWQATSQKK